MIWNVLQDALGNLQLLPVGDAIPDGFEIVATTANEDYIEYMASLGA